MTLLRTLDRILVRIETALLVLFLGVMVLLAFGQVVLRNLFDAGFLWGDTVVRHLVLWAGFIGGALASSEERHIGIDALTKFISDRTKSFVHIFTNLFAAVVCVFLASAALEFLLSEREAASVIILAIPTWVGISVVPVGYAMMAFHFLVRSVENALRAWHGTHEAAA